ncbi:FAD-binding oxidoreductase [Ancylobacter sp. 6x-1]|uniref:FAD-binding oxidoreductase n=1 Tax=Ancylobacter crimeensis TaxID=2579147 RepID=A0ABT0DE02_9HYPH|nr:FAD-binding oxidoreductase [Ancylobacter crimeensis]MCK0197972.1 FAD-binding oxidoreductase [Ancylobacter crimeensis]
MFDAETTEQQDLREGAPPWSAGAVPALPALKDSLSCDVAVIGAGISGAFIAEHLASLGQRVVVVDRERPGFGSTVASTAMLLWEIDRRLVELADLYGFERAATLYRRSHAAVAGLAGLVRERGIACGLRARTSLYLAAQDIGAAQLRAEHAARQRAGLPGTYLDAATLFSTFGIAREGAILSGDSADADPLLLAHGLLAAAAAHGARIFAGEAVAYESHRSGARIGLVDGHEIEAKAVVLATGYVMPDIVRSDLQSTGASWALATPPQPPGGVWPGEPLVWEACETYLYARSTVGGRIVIGGEDEDGHADREQRLALAPDKVRALLDGLAGLRPEALARAELVWSGAFSRTSDGLPLIGEVPDNPHIYAAYGYGGNGITFSFLASRLLARMIAGEREAWYADVALDRPAP